jgi:RNA polymerase-binding protein DksA
MSSHLTDQQQQHLYQRLHQMHQSLYADVKRELAASGHDHQAYVDEGAHDSGEASVADQLSELNLSLLEQHINALRTVEWALARMANDEYGLCIDSGEPIPFARLAANPTALRTIEYQERYERQYAQPRCMSL